MQGHREMQIWRTVIYSDNESFNCTIFCNV